MNKALRFCKHPGCNQLTTEGYCEQHKQDEIDKQRSRNDHRESASERGYDAQWAKLRRSFLIKHPLCEQCEKDNRVTPATVAHHIKPIEDGGARLDVNNLMALCRMCHEVHHGRKTKGTFEL